MVSSFPNFELKLMVQNQSVQKHHIKIISNGRRPRNNDSRISQELHVRFTPNLSIMPIGTNQSLQKVDQNGRRPQKNKSQYT